MEFNLGDKVLVKKSRYVSSERADGLMFGVINGQNYDDGEYYVEDQNSFVMGKYPANKMINVNALSEYEKLIYGI